MYFDLNLVLRVFTAPNSAFTQICNVEEKYFAQSIVILITSSFFGILAIIPFLIIPFDDSYFEEFEGFLFGVNETDMVFSVISSIVSTVVLAGVVYFVGKKLGGNQNWKEVFSVIFHVNALVFPMIVIFSILIFLMLDSLNFLDMASLTDPELDEQQALTAVGPMLGYGGLLVAVAIAFVVWIVIVSVKAIKVVDGFGTAKAFGLLILSMIAVVLVTLPLGM